MIFNSYHDNSGAHSPSCLASDKQEHALQSLEESNSAYPTKSDFIRLVHEPYHLECSQKARGQIFRYVQPDSFERPHDQVSQCHAFRFREMRRDDGLMQGRYFQSSFESLLPRSPTEIDYRSVCNHRCRDGVGLLSR